MDMNQFGEHATEALAGVDASQIPSDLSLVLEQQVTNGDTIVDQYHVVIADGAVRIESGAADNPDVVLKQDSETAEALRNGTLHSQRAFLTGRLSIDGDINALLEHGPLLAQLLPGLAS